MLAELDQWTSILTNLANFGGMGVLAAILLLLHREALKAFREALTTDRQYAREDRDRDRAAAKESIEKLLDLKSKYHMEVMQKLMDIQVERK